MDNNKDQTSISLDETIVKDMPVPSVPLAYHESCMQRNSREKKYIIIGWACSLIMIVIAFVYLWLQYDYVSTTEYSGVYNMTDSQGNVISSDITPDDIIRVMEVLNDGAYTSNNEKESQ